MTATGLHPPSRWLGGTARPLIAGVDVLSRALRPWVALGIRLGLAQAFLIVQVTALMLDAPAPLSGTWWTDAARQVAASGPGTVVQAVCPVLLVLGLLTRPAAAAMLLQVTLLPPSGMAAGSGVLWLALLGWLVVSGPGAFSLDRLLGRGAYVSPLPGARRARAAIAWIDARLLPVALLALRGLAAAAILALPEGMTAMLPQPVPIVLAVCLGLGLGVRVVAVGLALAVPGAAAAMSDRAFFVLLLGVLAVHGGGALSLDGALRRWLRAGTAAPVGPHVVIVGAGFGGLAAARGLASAACRVTLVDRSNHHLFQPLLYQVATAGLSPAEIATPIRGMFRDAANIRVLLAEVTGIDTDGGAVLMGETRLGYDMLVLATGARHAYFGHDEWSRHAPGLKSIEDATAIRARLLRAFEEAESTDDPAIRAACLTFVVVGGGPTGVELAGAIRELAQHGMDGEFRSIDPAQARVLLVQSGPRLLPSFPPDLSAAAAASLRALGVEVLLDRKVEGVAGGAALIDGVAVPARTILWAAGVMASPAARWLGVPADRAGRALVGPDLSVDKLPNVFVLGDTAASTAWDGNPVPGLAPAAKQAGAHVAGVIRARLAGRPPPPPWRYRHYGSLATIGRDAAVAEFGRLHVTGALAWWLWGAAHIAFLADGRSRVSVVLDWLWAYLTFKRSTRLITGAAAPE